MWAWVQNQDLTVTALNLMGIDHDGLDGEDAWAIATGKSAPIRDHITTGWGPNMNVRDQEYSVHFNVTEATPTPTVFDLKKDSEEDSPLAEPPSDVAAQALARAQVVVGTLPVTFTSYKQRHSARSMRTFAPRRKE